jgi:MinD superfamily P-loop ATPase
MYVAIASGKGGTGKTMISTSLALCAGECTYVDMDVEEPNGYLFLKPHITQIEMYRVLIPEIDEDNCTFCEKCSGSCQYNALSVIPKLKKVWFFEELCHSCGVCAYVCPAMGAIREVEKVIGMIRIGETGQLKFIEGKLNVGRASGVPLIGGIINNYINGNGLFVVDSAPGTSCPVVETLRGCDYAILVTEPTPFGLSDLKLAVEITKNLRLKTGIIINKDNKKNKIIEPFAREVNIPILLRVPYSIEIQKAYSRGIPLVEQKPRLKTDFKRVIQVIKENER